MLSAKRVVVCTILGFVFGVVCWGLASSNTPDLGIGIALMIVLSRTTMGFALGISALRLGWWVHAIILGVVFSLPMAFSGLGDPERGAGIFFGTIVMGVVYAILIELLATFLFKAKLGGDV